MLKKLIYTTGSVVLILFALICLKEGTVRKTKDGFELNQSALQRGFNKGVAKPIGGMAEEVSPPRK